MVIRFYFDLPLDIFNNKAQLNATTSRDRRSLALSRTFLPLFRLLVGIGANFGACPERNSS
jgi:hypothetical protein